MKKYLLAIALPVIFSGCAALSGTFPKTAISTNIPLFFRAAITTYNSNHPSVEIIPELAGRGYVAEYRDGKRLWHTLWLAKEKIPTKAVTLKGGQSATLPLPLNTGDRGMDVPFVLRVSENGKFIGFYSYCVRIYPSQNTSAEFNFGPRELADLKNGHTGYQCRRGFW
ncbi:MAG: hypothetical protein Q8P76_02600 [bacterium]|nr:hypothetical protein [bacterium]